MSSRSHRPITGTQNERVKQWRRWLKKPEEPSCPWLPVEGEKQIQELSRQRKLELLLVSDSRSRGNAPPDAAETVVLVDRLFSSLSNLDTPQGMIGFFRKPTWTWEQLPPRILYLDRLQDPGNLGLILRAAAAADFGVVAAPGTVSPFNPKVVRSSSGYLWRVPLLSAVLPTELERRGYQLWVADAGADTVLYEVEFREPFAVVVGREGGPDNALIPAGLPRFRIPMASGVDSLNAAIAASVVMYDVVRRREAHGKRAEDRGETTAGFHRHTFG